MDCLSSMHHWFIKSLRGHLIQSNFVFVESNIKTAFASQSSPKIADSDLQEKETDVK